jgi:hypothetical protein
MRQMAGVFGNRVKKSQREFPPPEACDGIPAFQFTGEGYCEYSQMSTSISGVTHRGDDTDQSDVRLLQKRKGSSPLLGTVRINV